MTVDKIKQLIINPQQLAQQVANEGLKAAVEKAINTSSEDYRVKFARLLKSQKSGKSVFGRFKTSESEVASFLDQVYEDLPSVFKDMIDKAVDEQGQLHGLSKDHQDELRRELANVIDQEIHLKGRFV